ncbi:helix-turn-helix domain-containing protein [Streptomyces beigongshangae]|uniref:helix-turn-helix domain-containing protein n=1 Tax=Streptomyces beigongshangae TaxID=2841597 RepID=UPI001C8650FA|nr:XRE family transcriptional regulator [Streptomyces sp. REN17]
MPRWKALPDELDPQVREFASQLRRLVDRSGLSVAAVADRTGYSKTSWERYLNGRLLAPKGAIVALAEVTGTNPVHLTTMWELAERAWSRSEMRHDMTMEAIRISQARAALGEFGPTPAKGEKDGKQARAGGSRTAAPKPGVAGPAGVAPTVPPRGPAQEDERRPPYGAGAGARPGTGAGARSGTGAGVGSGGESAGAATGARGGSWGVVPPPGMSGAAGYRGPGPSGAAGPGPSDGYGPAVPAGPNGHANRSGAAAGPPRDARPRSGGSPDGQRRKRRLTMFLAGVGCALVVIAGAVFLSGSGDGKGDEAKPSPSPTATKKLPPGVECNGSDCAGEDPENMGCGGTLARTVEQAVVGTAQVEVRYSETCGAAWARITAAGAGDSVRISAGSAAAQTAEVGADTDAYTPMVAVKSATGAKACATLQSGLEGCTE